MHTDSSGAAKHIVHSPPSATGCRRDGAGQHSRGDSRGYGREPTASLAHLPAPALSTREVRALARKVGPALALRPLLGCTEAVEHGPGPRGAWGDAAVRPGGARGAWARAGGVLGLLFIARHRTAARTPAPAQTGRKCAQTKSGEPKSSKPKERAHCSVLCQPERMEGVLSLNWV